MMENRCLLCESKERNFVQPDGNRRKYRPKCRFICSRCTQMLLMADPKDKGRAYLKAKRLGQNRKMRALESFLMEVPNEHRISKSNRRHDRTRTVNLPESEKNRLGRIAPESRFAVLQGKSHHSRLSGAGRFGVDSESAHCPE